MLEVIENYEEGNEDNDYRGQLNIVVKLNNKVVKSFDFYDSEPEDNNMSRNFSDVHSIVDAIQIAYEAGRDGEKISFDIN